MSRRSDRRRKEDRQAFFILGAAGVALAAIIALLVSTAQPDIDDNGCIVGPLVPPAHTVIVVDQTDSFSPEQLTYARTVILSEYARLARGERLTIVSLNVTASHPQDRFSKCRLPTGIETSELTGNPEEVEQAFDRVVGAELGAFIDNLANRQPMAASPIMEAVAYHLDELDFSAGVERRRLVLISDMAQHSNLVSHYSGGFRLSETAAGALRRDMSDVVVRVHYLRRDSLRSIQGDAHQNFWRGYFSNMGADTRLGWGVNMLDLEPPRPPNFFERIFGGGEQSPVAPDVGRAPAAENVPATPMPEPVQAPPEPEFAEAAPVVSPPAPTMQSPPQSLPATPPVQSARNTPNTPTSGSGVATPGPTRITPPVNSGAASTPAVTAAQTAPLSFRDVRWIVGPESLPLMRHYPTRAMAEGQGGRVVLNCARLATSRLHCTVASENPAGWGFGQAALDAASSLQAAGVLMDGRPMGGNTVRLPIVFQMQDEDRRSR